MSTQKSPLAVCIFGVLMGAVWHAAVAKQVGEDDSVRRWGRWAVLSPAAGQEETGFVVAEGTNLGSCQSAVNCPAVVADNSDSSPEPGPEPGPEALSPCVPGSACGFARIDTPYNKQDPDNPPDSSELAPFDLTINSEEGTVSFVVDPGTANEIASGTVPAIITPADLLGLSLDPVIVGTVISNDDGAPVVTSGPWAVGPDGGEYVWGVTATEVQMQDLIGSLGADAMAGDKIATYSGNTLGVTNGGEGVVSLTFNFSENSWSGQFDNNAFSVEEGVIVDSGFVTTAASKLSSNVELGKAYGVFVNAGDNAVGAYDVTLTGGSRLVDAFNTSRDSLDD